MKILVSGSSGFMGRPLCRSLAAQGHQVVPLVRDGLREPADFERAVAPGYDAVCHLAAFIPKNHADPAEAPACLQGNALFTLSLLRACVSGRAGRFVYYSAGNAYADGAGPADEREALCPSRVASYYLGSKVLAETWVEHFRLVHGLPAVSLRIASPYGEGMPERGVIPTFVRRARAGEPLEVRDPTYRVDLVHVDDVVGLTVSALQGGEPGVYNVGAGAAPTMLEVAQTVVEATGGRASISQGPAQPGQRGFRPLAIDRARRTWGFSPRPLAAGVRELLTRLDATPGPRESAAR